MILKNYHQINHLTIPQIITKFIQNSAMTAFQIQHTADSLQVTFDKKYFSEDELLKILNYLRVEFLARKIDFDQDIEAFGEEIKRDWWVANKHRFIQE